MKADLLAVRIKFLDNIMFRDVRFWGGDDKKLGRCSDTNKFLEVADLYYISDRPKTSDLLNGRYNFATRSLSQAMKFLIKEMRPSFKFFI